jgi:hypothetical protein
MKLLGLDHVGIVVRDIDETVARAGATVDGRAVGEPFVSDDIALQVLTAGKLGKPFNPAVLLVSYNNPFQHDPLACRKIGSKSATTRDSEDFRSYHQSARKALASLRIPRA